MKTSIELPDELIERVREYNKRHDDKPINVSGVCRMALLKALKSSDNLPGDGRGRHVPLPPTNKGEKDVI